VLYAAYGQLLNKSIRENVCPSMRLVATGRINGYRLVFKIHEDIEPDDCSSVPVLVFEVDDDDVKSLDKLYKRGEYYDVALVNVSVAASINGYINDVSAFTYVMLQKHKSYQRPDDWYLDIIRSGYKENGFDIGLLD
jgi:gamma-glutamylcyclotransferase (GGCT)/AIG2-like uncharacterized protein YtfP